MKLNEASTPITGCKPESTQSSKWKKTLNQSDSPKANGQKAMWTVKIDSIIKLEIQFRTSSSGIKTMVIINQSSNLANLNFQSAQ